MSVSQRLMAHPLAAAGQRTLSAALNAGPQATAQRALSAGIHASPDQVAQSTHQHTHQDQILPFVLPPPRCQTHAAPHFIDSAAGKKLNLTPSRDPVPLERLRGQGSGLAFCLKAQ